MSPELVYILCSATSLLCSVLLFKTYFRKRNGLLLWCGICFAGLALNNALLFVDLILLPSEINLIVIRTVPAFIGMGVLLYGLIRELTE